MRDRRPPPLARPLGGLGQRRVAVIGIPEVGEYDAAATAQTLTDLAAVAAEPVECEVAQLGPGGLPTMTMRFCLTPQDLAAESSHAFMQTLRENGDCTSKIIAESSSEVHLEAHCRAPDSKSDVDARIFNVAPEHYSVDLKSTGPRGDMHMQQQAGNQAKKRDRIGAPQSVRLCIQRHQ